MKNITHIYTCILITFLTNYLLELFYKTAKTMLVIALFILEI